VLAGRLLGNRGWVQLSKSEEPESKMTKLIDGIRDGIV
jgi:hypothetical protein